MNIARPIARGIAKAISAIPARITSVVTRGPELVTQPVGTGWSGTGTGASVGATSADFVNANNLAAVFHSAVTEDNTTYEVTYTIANKATADNTTGKARVIVYGGTTAHAGATTERLANGTYTEQVTTSAAGSSSNQIRIQATGTSGTNNFSVTNISVKKVLA